MYGSRREHSCSSQQQQNNSSIKKCCILNNRIKWFRSKSAILVLIWSFFVASLYHHYHLLLTGESLRFAPLTILIAFGLALFFPIGGWLADVYFGRYKIIHVSILIMWVSSILIVVCYIAKQVAVNWDNVVTPILYILYVVAGIGLGLFQANIIQFGVDQLTDASSTEISSFVIWYTWTLFSSGVPYLLLEKESSSIYRALLLVICISLTLCMDLLFNKWLVKEPITRNPFKLIFEVIKYMIRHRQPRQRSAFTFCEDEIPSRIDFGKSKYGGPFTTEQVEDVKTFFRMLVVLSIGSTVGLVCAVVQYPQHKLYKHLQGYYSSEWYKRVAYGQVIPIFIMVPVYELLIYPMFQKHLVHFNYEKIIIIATCISLLYLTTLVAVEGTVRHVPEQNHNMTCIFSDTNFTININYQWFQLIGQPNFIASFLFIVGAIEFICSQSPYAMKGILLGMCYSLSGFNLTVQGLIALPFVLKSFSWDGVPLPCGFWYFLLQILVTLTFGTTFIAVMKWMYKNRSREDVLPNDQVFAVQYYERYANLSSSSSPESDMET